MLAHQLVVGDIAVHLQDAAIAVEVSAHAIAGPAVLEAIGHHGRAAPAKGAVIAGIGPEPGRLRGAGAGGKGRKAGLIRKDARPLEDFAQNMVSQDLQLEARPAHPSAHQPPVDLHPVAGTDPS